MLGGLLIGWHNVLNRVLSATCAMVHQVEKFAVSGSVYAMPFQPSRSRADAWLLFSASAQEF
jgi:hypothetical protein